MSITLPALPYALEALEPHLSRHTLAAHHGHHHAAYVAKTRALIQGTPLESASLEDIVRSSAEHDRALFNAAAQAWNHAFYWTSMTPGRRRRSARTDRTTDRRGLRQPASLQSAIRSGGGRPVRQRLGMAGA